MAYFFYFCTDAAGQPIKYTRKICICCGLHVKSKNCFYFWKQSWSRIMLYCDRVFWSVCPVFHTNLRASTSHVSVKIEPDSKQIGSFLHSGQCLPQILHRQTSGLSQIDSEFYDDQEYIQFVGSLNSQASFWTFCKCFDKKYIQHILR